MISLKYVNLSCVLSKNSRYDQSKEFKNLPKACLALGRLSRTVTILLVLEVFVVQWSGKPNGANSW